LLIHEIKKTVLGIDMRDFHFHKPSYKVGAKERIRTSDLTLIKSLLYQLSYLCVEIGVCPDYHRVVHCMAYQHTLTHWQGDSYYKNIGLETLVIVFHCVILTFFERRVKQKIDPIKDSVTFGY
tara:strand:+ start:1046 stop:1414 length:369 start_codon:yes stop_codon:yes gene_type:complete